MTIVLPLSVIWVVAYWISSRVKHQPASCHIRPLEEFTLVLFNNALIELRKQGGPQGRIAEGLLLMRDVPLPRLTEFKQMRRGQTAKLVLDALQHGPKTCPEICDRMEQEQPDLPRYSTLSRVDNCLRRLRGKGLVRREGRVWALAQ